MTNDKTAGKSQKQKAKRKKEKRAISGFLAAQRDPVARRLHDAEVHRTSSRRISPPDPLDIFEDRLFDEAIRGGELGEVGQPLSFDVEL